MEMLARFERGETEGGEGGDVNGLEELLKGMGGIDGEQETVEEEAADEGFDALETLKQRLSDGSDLGSFDAMLDQSEADILFLQKTWTSKTCSNFYRHHIENNFSPSFRIPIRMKFNAYWVT